MPPDASCFFRRWLIATKVKGAATAAAKPSQTEDARQTHVVAENENARQFSIEAARLAAATRCHNVVVLDVRGISPVTDYMVLATGTSNRQMKTVADELEELGGKAGNPILSRAGDEGISNWIAIDFFDVVIHVFDQEGRMYYDLDGLWGDAQKIEWETAEAATAR
jgi:ribosome-associated protein